MSQQDAFAEAVFFFDGDDISVEMHYSEFEALLNQTGTLENFAASQVRGAYAVVGTGLAVRGLVTFMLRIDENGHADPAFSVPLRHLVRHAGPGPDIGWGTIRLASRAQCSVSWHAMNLWEPEGEGESNPIRVVQRAAWRNRLGLKLSKSESAGETPFLTLPGGDDVDERRASGIAGREVGTTRREGKTQAGGEEDLIEGARAGRRQDRSGVR